MKRFVPSLLKATLSALLALGAAPAFPSPLGTPGNPVRIGISQFAESSVNLPVIPATVKLLEETLGKDSVRVTTYRVSELQRAAKAGETDIILSSAGTYRRLAIEGAGVRDIATVVSERAPNPNYADGSVFFVRRDRTDILSVHDLIGHSVAANHVYGFSGWQVALGEIKRRGFDPDHFFGRIDFKGHDMPLVVGAVERGETDAGIVRACFLEDRKIDMTKFRVLDPRPSDGTIECARSTDLYPNWTVSTLPTTPPEISRRVAAALLSMKPIENGLHWSIATDFRPIDSLFLELKIGPYEYLREFSLKRFVSDHSTFFTVLLTLVAALIAHSAAVTRLVKLRTRALEDSIERERKLEHESRLAQDRYNSLQRAGIVGQMSSIIAHELRQPLASISMYCYGLLRRFENGNDSRGVTVASLEKISEQTERASAIVDQVRGYAKGNRSRSPQNFAAVTSDALENSRKSLRLSGVEIAFTPPAPPVFVEASALELELIVINLVKNAVDANSGRAGARVAVTLGRENGFARLAVEDNGPPLTESEWESILMHTVRSTKSQGLGLGLSIVRSISKDLGGETEFSRPAAGGLRIEVSLPLCVPEEPVNDKDTHSS